MVSPTPPAAGSDADARGSPAQRFGCFGKLPGAGDFVSRRMPDDLREFWDRWCAEGIDALKAASTASGLDVWGATPTWAFMLPVQPGLSAGQVGVFAPSCDRVGRIFPFVVAAPLVAHQEAQLLHRAALLGLAWAQVVTQAQVERLGIEAVDVGLQAALAAVLASEPEPEDDEQTTMPMGLDAYPPAWPCANLSRRFDARGSESCWWSVPPAATGHQSRMYTGALKSLHFLDLCRGNR